MKEILVVTVGGSAEPVVNAVKSASWDFVYFLCSSGPKGSEQTVDSPGDPCGDKRKTVCPHCGKEHYIGDPKGKAIVYQAGLDASLYEIITVDDPDDLNECMKKLDDLSERVTERHGPKCRIVANYTGGTKTMSVALGLYSVYHKEWDLAINRGMRNDLVKVRCGDLPVAVDKWAVFCEIQVDVVRKAIDRFEYDKALEDISGLLSRPIADRVLKKKLEDAYRLCRAFDYWDRFDHQKALNLLKDFGKDFSSHIVILKKILGKTRGSGYELVGDLMKNAERRAYRGYYDDAVARLYRATELFAQVHLDKKHALPSGKMTLADLPENLREEYASRQRDDGRILLGLHDDYELLHRLGDPVGKAYKEREERILSALQVRNNSIYAHGLEPLSEEKFNEVNSVLSGFIHETATMLGLEYQVPQLPQKGII